MASEDAGGSSSSAANPPPEAPAAAVPAATATATATATAAEGGGDSTAAPAAAAAPKKTTRKVTKNYSTDPALYIYTSLTAGNMHIVTATSRLETILRANRVPFKALDMATDEKARMLWGRRAGKAADGRQRRLPALVQQGIVLGDIVEIEEWNEYGELKQHVKIYYDEFTQPAKGSVAPKPKYKQPANREAHPPAALNPPPPPPMPVNPAKEAAGKMAAAVMEAKHGARSVAEDAAAKAKAIRLEKLRAKVHGAKKEGDGGSGSASASGSASGSPTTEEAKKETNTTEPPTKEMSQLSIATTASTGAGLQSPTTGAWKQGASISSSMGEAPRTAVQSPTTSSWKPPAETSLAGDESSAGARVAGASVAEIESVEKKDTITEEPEKEAGTEAGTEAGAGPGAVAS